MKNRNFLTAYFSHTGNTREAAKRIQNLVGGDLYEIKPQKEYPKPFLLCAAKAAGEKIKDSRPEISNPIEDVDSYTDILIGYPAWCGSCPKIILSFLESVDLDGKRIYLFNTDMGTGSVGSEEISTVLDRSLEPSIEINKKSNEEVLRWLKL